MTNDGAGSKPTRGTEARANKRDLARQKARELRLEHKKKDRRNKKLLQGSVIVASLVVAAIVGFTIWSQIPTTRTGPVNMLSDGVKIGEGFVAENTPGLQPGSDPVPSAIVEGSEVIDIRVYVDYHCPGCREFEETNHDQLTTWVETGAATLEIHPIAMHDRFSLGKKYSTRSANAAACVANYSPNSFYSYNSLLFANQPDERTEGLTDEELFTLAKRADVTSTGLIEKCIEDQNYKSWVNAATARAVAGPIPGSDIKRVSSTPTVIVNGAQYQGPLNDPVAFATFVSTALGDAFTQKNVESETPTPTPTPSETPAS